MGNRSRNFGNKTSGKRVKDFFHRCQVSGECLSISGIVEYADVVSEDSSNFSRLDGLLSKGLFIMAHNKAVFMSIRQPM